METSHSNKPKTSRRKYHNPQCTGCKHPVSLHGKSRQACKAVGCHCAEYLPQD